MAGSRRRKNVNTKRSGNTRGRNTSLSAINKNKPATQKTVVSKPKSAATNKSTVSGRALRNESARKANTGNTQRQKKTTKPQERKSFSSRTNNYQGTSGNRRKQMTAQTQKTAQDNLKKTANTMKNLTKGNIKQIAGSHATTFNSIRNPNEEMYARAEEFKRQRGDYDNQKKSPYSEGQYGQLLNRERNNKEQREKNLAKASRKIDSGTKLIEKEKEKVGEAGKFVADLYGAGLGLASDALAGPASMVSMFSRSYGSSYKTAKDEGATDSQAALYGAAAGGLEVATEKLFAVAKPLQKIYGKGAGDKIFDTLLDKVAKKATSKGANDLIYHGGKTLGSFVSEALEEMIVEGLEPSIANQIYAEAVGTPHETSAKDVLYAGLLGGAMGGILGGGGQIMEYSRGEQVKDIYGEDGLKAAADRVSQADEDSGNGAMGTLVKDMISAGEDVNARYANELYKADRKQMAKDSEKLDVARTVAENSIRKENLKSPVAVDDKGEIMLSRNTKAKYDETVARAQEEADKLQVPDLTREKLAESVARIQTGTADVNDVNLFLLNNPEARTVYQVVTGESLPKTNQETRQYLYEKIGNNLITAAKIETADHADRIKGVMEQNLSTDYEVSGQEAFAQHFQGIDIRNVQQVEHDVITFDDYYRAARNGISYEQVEAYQNPIHMGADTEFKRMAYEAGQRDVAISLDTAKGMQLELGKAVSKSSSKQRSRAGKGRLISEISPEMQMEFSASQQVMYRMLARAFNINIHVVDTLQNEDGAKTNGYYVDGEVYLSLDGDRSLEYIFAHEITHHMQAYAPKEYNQLKELVRQRWAQKGGIDAAVNAKKAQYAKGGVNLSYEDALDEIIADSTYEMLQDEGFVDELCRSHRNVAQRLLDAIRDVLAKLRNVLAEGDSFTPQQNAGLLSELDILKDFERIWANGLMRAAENRDAVTKGNVLQVKYSKHDDSTIKDQIAANLDVLNAMEPVANITYESIAHLSRSQKADLIFEEFSKQFKGGLERKGFGYIVLRYDEITNSLKYLHTDGEFAAFFTVPKVLKRGIVIKEKIDHKSKKENTVTIAAPVVINGVRGNVGAIVKLGGKKRYHVHRILMPDGSVFSFENKKTEPNGVDMITNNGKQGPTISSALNKSISDLQQKGNKKLSLPDTEYMVAVEKGDMETAQRMVDEAAEAAMKHSEIRDNKGKLLKVYHGTTAKFNSFNDPNHTPYGEQGNFYFSPWRSKSEEYGDNIRAFYLNIERPRLYDENFDELNPNTDETDGFIFIPEDIEQDIDQGKQGDTEIVAYYPDQIKSADPVTYDDDGNVIPLSERFNSQSDDIRYSLPDTDSTGRELSEGQREYFANSKAVDDEGKLVPVFHTTPHGGFTEFNNRFSDDRRSFFFTDNALMSMSYAENPKRAFTDKVETLDDLKRLYNVNGNTPARGMIEFSANSADGHVLYSELNEYIEAFEKGEAGDVAYFDLMGMSDEVDGVQADVVKNATTAEEALGNLIEEANSNLDELIIDEGYYEVYLNLENPLIIDGAEQNWDEIEGYADNELTLGTKSIEEAYDTVESLEKLLGNSYQHVMQEADDTYVYYEYDVSQGEYDEVLRTADFTEMRNYILNEVADPDDVESSLRETHNTRGWAEIAQELGHDGVIFKNIYDNGPHGYFSHAGDVYVAFSPEQIKAIDNTEPTENEDIRYSLQDSEGRELTEGQQEYFANSQIRDEDGRLIPMYHGTPNGDYDAFRKGTYFTANKDYADVYQSQGASSLGYKKTANKPNTHEVYLNIEKPFDTRNPKEKKIFKEEFLGQWGTGTPLMNSGLPDWLDGEDLIEFLEEKGYDYDGLILDEGGVGGYGDEVVSRGFSYVIFDSNQAKSIDNENPTDDPRMRYSLADTVEETNQTAIDHFGETDSWEETGYLLTDGRQLDFSGRHWGSDAGGRREVDHRDIWDAFEPAGMQGFDAMMAFMNAGNIRIMPETPGIDIAVMPTSEQEEMLEEYIEYFSGDITLDIDNGEGVTVSSTIYPMGTSSSKILNDIRTYFTTGEKPYVSEVAMFRYSLPDEESVYDYINTHETEFVEVPPVKDYERAARTVQTKSVEELQKQVEILKRDKRLTHGKELDKASIKPEMTELIKVLMSHSEGARGVYDRKLVNLGMENANIIYRAFKDGDMASVTNTAYYAAKEIVENLKFIDDTAFIHYKELRDIMKNTAVTISEADKADIPDYSEFYKNTFGRLKIVNEGGMPVDDLYATLAEAYPDLFDSELTNPADQLMAMADVRESLEPYDVMLSAEETEQLIKETAHDLIEVSLRGKPWKSWADRQKEVYDNKLKTMKAMHKEALNDLRIKERMRATRMVDKEKLKAKEYKEKQKDGKARAKSNGSIMKNYKWLADRLVKPTDDKHIPDEFRKSLADMLQVFDLQSARSKALEEKYGEPSQKTIKMWELRARLSKIAKEDDTGIFEYDGYVFDLMEALANRIDGLTLDQASTEDLASIDTLLKAIVTNIRNYNKAFSDDIKATISGLAEKTIEADNERIAKRGKKADRSGILGGADKILNESMVTPRDFFELLGGGIEDCFQAMRKGFDKHVDNITKTRTFFDKIFSPYNKKTKFRKRAKPGSIVESWRDGTMMQEFALESGESIKLNPAQMMSLYCLMKREQAQGHIFGSGIVASRVDNASKIKQALGAKIETQGSAVMITLADAEKIISSLTQEQIDMADQLQDYLNNECAEWGNEVSIKLYGYSKFTEKNYFPIKSADQYLDSNFEERQAAERIKNFGFTKGTVVNANNPIMIDDIFRVVGDHINKMSLYNAFAAPISDFTRVYNYKGRSDNGVITGSVKSSLEDAYGKKAIEYINNFMADVNNTTQTRTEGVVRFIDKSLANYKKATIAGNIRVALQQPTAVMRAFMVMSPKWFVNSNVNVKKNLQDMKEHCQIARWKSWGHNQVDMARDIDDIMMNKEWQYLDALTMAPYGALDNITWSTIWAAIRKETAALHPEVKIDSEEFYALCNDRASEVFDKTQVVDSVFHRSQVMRNKDSMSKMVTSFMAEPTRTFNMLRTEFVEAREMWNEGDKSKAVRLANKALSIFIINAAAVSAAAAVADALRGKDADGDGEEDDWLENFLANFWGNVNPANMIPVVSDIWGFTDGWGSSNMALEGYEALVKSIMSIPDADNKGEAIRKLAESVGMVFGIPVKNVLREMETAFKFFGIDVFAAEAGEESATEKETLLEKLDLKEGGVFDGVLNKFGFNRTEEEKLEASFDKRVKQYERSTRKMTSEEKDEYLWGEITEGYTTAIEDGDFSRLADMRAMLKAAGGDVEKFDKSVISKVQTALKKSINDDVYMTYEYKNFLMEQYDLTEGKINQDMIMKSETATNFQIACCTNDQVNMLLAMSDLYAAGLTTGEIEILYATRSKAIKGKNFSTGEFISPVTGEITSGFGYRGEPIAGAGNWHNGLDIAVPSNSDVAAADGGKVSSSGYDSGLGYYVKIDHGNGRYTTYGHLNGYYVQTGDAVVKGQTIGLSGSTGLSTGPHLHFAVTVNGEYVDPSYFL